MFKKLILGFIAALMLLTTPAFADNPDKIGKGDYFTFYVPGTTLNQAWGEVIRKWDVSCRDATEKQRPPVLKEIFITSLRNAPGAAIGGFLGSKAGGLISPYGGPTAVGYAKYNAIATAGGSIGAGITTFEMGKHTAVAGCMINLMNMAHQMGYMRNAWFAYSSFATRGHPLRISKMQSADQDSIEDAQGLQEKMMETEKPSWRNNAPNAHTASTSRTNQPATAGDSDDDGIATQAPPH